MGVLATVLICALFGPWIAPHDATTQYREATLQPPFWQEGGSLTYLLGTDPLGRDMLSRLIVGARYSFFVGIVVVSIAATGGIIVGLISGFSPKWVDTIIMRIMNINRPIRAPATRAEVT